MEREGLRFLFLLPGQPRWLFLGKNLAVAVVLAIEMVGAGLLLAFLGGGWERLPVALVATLGGCLVTLAVGNVVAVLLPARMPDGLRATYGADSGCARGLLQLAAFFIVWVLMAPIAFAVIVPELLVRAELHLLAAPLALAYGAAVYWLTLRQVGPLLIARQPEILEITTRE
jgi:hypothetical protein